MKYFCHHSKTLLLMYTAVVAIVLSLWSVNSSAEVANISDDSSICCSLEPMTTHDIGEIDDHPSVIPSSGVVHPIVLIWSPTPKSVTLSTTLHSLFRPPIG